MPKKTKEVKNAETQTDMDMSNMKVKDDTNSKGKRVYRVESNPYNKLMYHSGKFSLTFD